MTIRLKAALGKVVITPEEISPLQGYDPDTHVADPTKDVMDELFARVLLLDDGKQRKVIVSVDCCLTNEDVIKVADPAGRHGYYREFGPTFPPGTREKWAHAANTDLHGISVHGTHTHTAPAHYSEKYTDRIERLIRELEHKLVPVQWTAAEGISKISAFRRPTLHADLSVPVNQSLKVLVLQTEDKRPIGGIVNFAVHPTALRNPASRISGDIVGLAVSQVEEHFGEGFTALFLQGFSGDICPLFGDNGPTEDTYPDVVRGSRIFAADVINTINRREPVSVTGYRSLSRTFSLPTREHYYKPAMDVTLVGFSLGDIAVVAVSGEIFNGYIEKIESISPYRTTLLSGVANGYSGYLPTKLAFEDGMGGYEMNTTPYTDAAEQLFLTETGQFLHALTMG